MALATGKGVSFINLGTKFVWVKTMKAVLHKYNYVPGQWKLA